MYFQILITLAISSLGNSGCVRGFGKCYTYFDQKMNWYDAVDFCASPRSGVKNGILVIERSQQEADFIHKTLLKNASYTYWLGVFTTLPKGGWKTVLNEPLSWSKWHPGQTDDSDDERCSASYIYDSQRGWNDEGCVFKYRVVCESHCPECKGIYDFQRGWNDEDCVFKYRVVCESREIFCECRTGLAKWYHYDTKEKVLKNLKKWCCCRKTAQMCYTPGKRLPIPLTEVTTNIRNVCDNLCFQSYECISFLHLNQTNECVLYKSPDNERLPQEYDKYHQCRSP